MRCHICNRRLNIDEIEEGRDGKLEPCGDCLAVAADLVALDEEEEVYGIQ
jgi:hypothetical protein|tara:strand:- start:70 stop:219 length:150 start_codon:yes stop_codon:yes gene_type:complete